MSRVSSTDWCNHWQRADRSAAESGEVLKNSWSLWQALRVHLATCTRDGFGSTTRRLGHVTASLVNVSTFQSGLIVCSYSMLQYACGLPFGLLNAMLVALLSLAFHPGLLGLGLGSLLRFVGLERGDPNPAGIASIQVERGFGFCIKILGSAAMKLTFSTSTVVHTTAYTMPQYARNTGCSYSSYTRRAAVAVLMLGNVTAANPGANGPTNRAYSIRLLWTAAIIVSMDQVEDKPNSTSPTQPG